MNRTMVHTGMAALAVAATLTFSSLAMVPAAEASQSDRVVFCGEPAISYNVADRTLDERLIKDRAISCKVEGPGHIEAISNCFYDSEKGIIWISDVRLDAVFRLHGDVDGASCKVMLNGQQLQQDGDLIHVKNAGSNPITVTYVDEVAKAKAEAEAKAKAEAEEKAAKEAAAKKQAQSSGSSSQSSNNSSSSYSGSKDGWHTCCVEISGEAISYIGVSKTVKTAPDGVAGLWIGDGGVSDNAGSWFIGHNPGVFQNLIRDGYGIGSHIGVWDSTGAYKSYTVDSIIEAQYGTNMTDDMKQQVFYSGECAAFQTCLNYNNMVRIFVCH